MFRYYVAENFNPTYARLENADRLSDFMAQRLFMLQNRLHLPLQMWADRSVLEFGPAAGENALVNALLGAYIYLVEPVEAFHEKIRDYFTTWGQDHRLKQLTASTFNEFQTDKRFTMVIAEGFVYTTGPAEQWTRRLASFCNEQGFILVSFPVISGFLIEMLQSRICRMAAERYNLDKFQAADLILGAKWQSIPHSRSFESWANDVLFHPFIRHESLNHPDDIIKLMYNAGLDLYASWPLLAKPYDVTWIRKTPSRENLCNDYAAAALALQPSLLLGQPVPVKSDITSTILPSLRDVLEKELRALDALNANDETTLEKVLDVHGRSCELLTNIVTGYNESPLAKMMHEVEMCLRHAKESPEKISSYFHPGQLLGDLWGSPNFYMVFHRAAPVKKSTLKS
ncbi:MAG: methyltransferase domain-containing protein [Sedimentisphaerales bacterium]|nr:methyltransferase domain-containing protein [Sedimentisphaerales bacterium]